MKHSMDEQHKVQMDKEREEVRARMGHVRHKILVLSGKGGVGKSTVAANLAVALARDGHRVGLLDVDIHGPSIPQLLGVRESSVPLTVPGGADALLQPVPVNENLSLISMGSLLQDQSAAVIWRGPMKYNAIKQFLKDVAWGDLDYLIVDSPPGTGDEPLAVIQLLENATGAVVVTTPQELAVADVRRCITFCRQLALPVLGLIENMSGLICPHCGKEIDVFGTGGGERLAAEVSVPFLGRIPMDPAVVAAGDSGRPYVQTLPETAAGKAFEQVCRKLLVDRAEEEPKRAEAENMRIAIPLAQGKLSMHFGHCEQFALIDTAPRSKEIISTELVAAPDHQPGLLPRWLSERGAQVIIAGGMGSRAQGLFSEQGIEVVVGAPPEEPEAIAGKYLQGVLTTADNICDH